MSDIKKTIVTVRHILSDETKKVTRENDNVLLAYIWYAEVQNIMGVSDLKSVTAEEVLFALYKGNLTSPESIIRARRKVQEQYPELRGSNYAERQGLSKTYQKEIFGRGNEAQR